MLRHLPSSVLIAGLLLAMSAAYAAPPPSPQVAEIDRQIAAIGRGVPRALQGRAKQLASRAEAPYTRVTSTADAIFLRQARPGDTFYPDAVHESILLGTHGKRLFHELEVTRAEGLRYVRSSIFTRLPDGRVAGVTETMKIDMRPAAVAEHGPAGVTTRSTRSWVSSASGRRRTLTPASASQR